MSWLLMGHRHGWQLINECCLTMFLLTQFGTTSLSSQKLSIPVNWNIFNLNFIFAMSKFLTVITGDSFPISPVVLGSIQTLSLRSMSWVLMGIATAGNFINKCGLTDHVSVDTFWYSCLSSQKLSIPVTWNFFLQTFIFTIFQFF
jgi:hypothetical protein